ncbi:MAG: hypothetical protein ACXVAC_16435 [Vulcanimicrobiaceae bacterium]
MSALRERYDRAHAPKIAALRSQRASSFIAASSSAQYVRIALGGIRHSH